MAVFEADEENDPAYRPPGLPRVNAGVTKP